MTVTATMCKVGQVMLTFGLKFTEAVLGTVYGCGVQIQACTIVQLSFARTSREAAC